MKKGKYILMGAILVGLGFTSCSDYLNVDRYFKEQQSNDHIFENKDYTLQWLSFCYSRLQGDNIEVGHSDICPTNFSDDQAFNEGNNGDRYRKFKLGEYGYGYSYGGYYTNSWPWAYDAIYQASILINNIYKNKDFTQEEITDVKGQARFLRAYFYWLLLKKYGPVPIMPIEGADYTKSYEELSFPRNTYDECVEFITSEMQQAAFELFERRDNLNICRPTKGAALAVRAKVFLYGASPLANGNTEMADFTDKSGRILIPQEYDESKWAKAAAAAKDMIEYAEETGFYRIYTVGVRKQDNDKSYPSTITPPPHEIYSNKNFPEGWQNIDPFESYRAIFNGELYAAENPELIFTRGLNKDGNNLETAQGIADLVRHQLPASCGGWNIHGVTQKQCDAYDMAWGEPFDRATCPDGYVTNDNKQDHLYDHVPNDVHMEYTNREPRFYASIAYNGCVWDCASAVEGKDEHYRYIQRWYYRGADDGRINGGQNWLITGIGVKKYVHPTDCANHGGSICDKVEPTLRYADILLIYAESLNNLTSGKSYDIASWDGSKTHTIKRDIEEMRRGVKPIRMRAGLPDYDNAVYQDPKLFFNKLVHERQIEFFNENQRFFDLRRWKIAEEHESEQIYGCNTLVNRDHRDAFYTPVRVANLQTSFSRKQYFWPITYDELKRNKNMTQAPGWQDYD